ncbi:hypothetical protein ACQEV2_41505 [Streptomyces sp. CA-251387]|uniref:hypothetical protein n=1 Tax=Streptomyces sp. CA-251387 TaxID=3240064 RepID=UPI003D8DDCC3
MADVELAEPAQLPPDVIQVEQSCLVDPQPHIGCQPGDRVVAGGRAELAAGDEFLAPSGEQFLDLRLAGRDAQLRFHRGPRPVHLVQRALDHTAGEVVQFDLVPQLKELEEHRQRPRPAGPGRGLGVAEHLAEVHVRVGRLHVPQQADEPVPNQVQVVGVVADRAVDQPGRRPREYEPRQYIGLELVEFLLARRGPVLAQVAYDGQSQPTPPRLHPD